LFYFVSDPQQLLDAFPSLPPPTRLALINGLLPMLTTPELLMLSSHIGPRLKRDFLRDLPQELALHVLSFVSGFGISFDGSGSMATPTDPHFVYNLYLPIRSTIHALSLALRASLGTGGNFSRTRRLGRTCASVTDSTPPRPCSPLPLYRFRSSTPLHLHLSTLG
jgi:hypothetical protein